MTDVAERVKSYQQFIGGEWVDSAAGGVLDVENPADGKVIARVQGSDAEDVDRAANAAATAFETWQHTTPAERSLMLLKLADALEARGEELGRLESRNAGKPVPAAIDEIPVLVDNLRFFAGGARVMEGKAVNEYMAGHTSMIRREPVGVVASIAPWNYPLMMAGWSRRTPASRSVRRSRRSRSSSTTCVSSPAPRGSWRARPPTSTWPATPR